MRRGGEMGDTVGKGGRVSMEGGGDEKGRGDGGYGWEGREGIDGGRWR